MNFAERLHNTIVQNVLYAITPKLDFYPDELRKEVRRVCVCVCL